MANKVIHILGGGTVSYLRPHFAFCAPAYGNTARQLADICRRQDKLDVRLHLTRMAGGGAGMLESNNDVARLIEEITADPATRIVILSCALCDFDGEVVVPGGEHGKHGARLNTRAIGNMGMIPRINFWPAEKVVGNIRKNRKDIFAVAFKQATGATEDQQYLAGLGLLKEAGVNLVLANDTESRLNLIVTPEEARYHVTYSRDAALHSLVDMALKRSQLTFTRSTVVSGDTVPWDSGLVPPSLRTVVDYCIRRGAYKPFMGATVGHFACKINSSTFLTSIRKSNFNDLPKVGLVKVVTDGPDSVIAYGAKPSVGGQSQRIVFNDHRDCDCIVHFHCLKRPGSEVPEASQREYECGSHECGQNTSSNLAKCGNLYAVYLQEHGPNIVFNQNINPQEVIDFIEKNFDLEAKTGGYVSLGQILKTPDALDSLRGITE
jgi:hypothetical protein